MSDESHVELSSSSRRYIVRRVFAVIFACMSIAGLYHMRIRPAQTGIPIEFEDSVARRVLTYPGPPIRKTSIRKHFTGVEPVDQGLQFIVAAFISGPANVESRIWYQQFHFLAGFAPLLGVWTVESCRNCWQRHGGVKRTSAWAVFYQSIGGAVIVPLHSLYFVIASGSRDMSPHAHGLLGQEVDLPLAKALVPALVFGYVIPTASLYLLPSISLHTMMGLVAFWQVTPIVVNLLLAAIERSIVFLAHSRGKEMPGNIAVASAVRRDAPYLYAAYATLAVFAGLTHMHVIWAASKTASPLDSISSIFIPQFSDAETSTAAGLHNIFQWDWLLIALSQLLWALWTTIDIKLAGGTAASIRVPITLLLLGPLSIGPGATVACVWIWKEYILSSFAVSIHTKKQ